MKRDIKSILQSRLDKLPYRNLLAAQAGILLLVVIATWFLIVQPALNNAAASDKDIKQANRSILSLLPSSDPETELSQRKAREAELECLEVNLDVVRRHAQSLEAPLAYNDAADLLDEIVDFSGSLGDFELSAASVSKNTQDFDETMMSSEGPPSIEIEIEAKGSYQAMIDFIDALDVLARPVYAKETVLEYSREDKVLTMNMVLCALAQAEEGRF